MKITANTELCQLARKWYTDKTKTTENTLSHNYTPYYHELLKGQGRIANRILEIGLGWSGLMHSNYRAGGSLFMWQDYFPQAEIFGLEIREDCLVNEGHIRSFQCDQSNETSLRKATELIGGTLDFIVDDGSHIPMDQVLTAKVFMPLLAEGGLYIIEDVHTTTGRIYEDMDELTYVCKYLGFLYEVVEVENETLPDDRLIIVHK
jgi:hypothetical protein